MKKYSSTIISVVIFCAVIAAQCSAAVIYVDKDAPGANNGTRWLDAYRFLKDALTEATSGDTIQIAQGIYKPDESTANPNGSGDRAAYFSLNGITLKGSYAGYGHTDPNVQNIRAFETILSGDLNDNDGPNFANNGENSLQIMQCNGTVFLDGLTISGGNGYPSKSGAGIYTCSNCHFTMTNCIIRSNSASYGGALFNNSGDKLIANCLFTGNRATASDTGVIHSTPCNFTLINCTISNNSGGGLNGSQWYTYYTITNCIFWNNGGTSEAAQIGVGVFTINYSCIQGWTGSQGGISNNGNDPLFVDVNGPGDNNYHLQAGSPCIDTGDNSAIPAYIVSDIEGHERIINSTVDRGAYEYSIQVEPLINVIPSTLEFSAYEGDVNQNVQTITVGNSGTGTLNWQISADCNWLQAEPNSGSSTGEMDTVNVLVDTNGLRCGIYDCNLIITDQNAMNSPVVVRVKLEIFGEWRNYIIFPNDSLDSNVIFESDPRWVKFTIKLDDPCTVYFQNSKMYEFHYDFATEWLEPFIGMTVPEFFNVTLYDANQQASLGAVILPPMTGNPPVPEFNEYGILFIRYDPYTKEEVASMFNAVKNSVIADPCITAFYFPTYEQLASAEANQAWFESQGIPIGSLSRWIEGNVCYSRGWAIGELKYVTGDQIQSAYINGDLGPYDILMTDGVPAEVPYVAGIISLSASTPNSHVAILSNTYGIPFVYLANTSDVSEAWGLVNKLTFMCVQESGGVANVQIIDAYANYTDDEIAEMLDMKTPGVLDISPIVSYGSLSADANNLLPGDINKFGGKAANYGMLRTSIPGNSPRAAAISFDLWNAFLDQPLTPCASTIIDPCGYVLFWADSQPEQGVRHTNFKLSKSGEAVGLFDGDGTLIDGLTFGAQSQDVSYGRTPDGNNTWTFFSGIDVTPNASNPGGGASPTQGLFINEFMADNTAFADEFSEYDDWIEIYNAGPAPIDLGGMYLTDDLSDTTKWMIPVGLTGNTLREEIANRLAGFYYPPSNLAELSAQLAVIRNIITNPNITYFTTQQQDAIIALFQDPNYDFDPNKNIRFRSSTNVEDSEKFSGAGLYDSYSGCLADDLDADTSGPCACDSNETAERGVFRAIRKVLASFYNDNAYLERMRHEVNEANVGMAMLVHHSFPDEIELANGVATMERKSGQTSWDIKLVTQKGAVSVTNPVESGLTPEEVSAYADLSGGGSMTLVHQSNLVILGEKVMIWQDDYNNLIGLLVAAAQRFEQVTSKAEYILDFEYKKVAPGGAALPAGGIEVDQIRQIPPVQESSITCPSFDYTCTCYSPGHNIFVEHSYEDLMTGISIETSYCLNCPPGMICMIYDLGSWCRTVIRGFTTKPIILQSSDSQDYSAGQHNWCESFYFTPSLEPEIDQCLLKQLRAKDIRVIHLGNMTVCGTTYIETTGFGAGPYYLGDFEPDGDVDLMDFAMFAQSWLDTECGLCGNADLDCDQNVGFWDLAMFTDNWLAQ